MSPMTWTAAMSAALGWALGAPAPLPPPKLYRVGDLLTAIAPTLRGRGLVRVEYGPYRPRHAGPWLYFCTHVSDGYGLWIEERHLKRAPARGPGAGPGGDRAP